MQTQKYTYSTRELLVMAALASLGGVSGTYINTLGDAVQSVLGFAGATQWAAGLHTLWLVLAAALAPKAGAGTITGILKGAVELLSGNSHGLLVVLIDIVAGILVDFGFLLLRRRDRLAGYLLSGGLAAASNVLVFQFFAAIPTDTLAYWALLLVAAVAGLSGMILSGYLAFVLVKALENAGVAHVPALAPASTRTGWVFFAAASLMAVLLGIYLHETLKGSLSVEISGAVAAPYVFPGEHGDIQSIEVEATMRGTTASYQGLPVNALLQAAQPQPGAGWLLVQGSDGYSFFITMDEVISNGNLLLSPQGKGEERAFNLVGAQNSKAWVRGVAKLIAIQPAGFAIDGKIERPAAYDAGQWQFEMDSTQLSLESGSGKYQGAPLGQVLAALGIQPDAKEVVVQNATTEVVVTLADLLADEDLRIFTIINQEQVSYALARMSGEVLLPAITAVQVR